MFLQIHALTNYHATLLNRDDAGLAKRIQFGGAPRLRISSQCQKRHWREWMSQQTDLPKGLRSRHFFNRELLTRVLDAGVDQDLARSLVLHLASKILTAAGEKSALDQETLRMKQPVLFGRPEAEYLSNLIVAASKKANETDSKEYLDERIKESKKNLKQMLRQSGIPDPAVGFEGALFGRFVTSDILARTDAPVHVAHAFTTHALDTEVDFFTVVDDLAEASETGAAHAGDMELGGGTFYAYVAVDVPLLVSNLTGCNREEWQEQDTEDARSILELLINAVSQVSPGAKLGATAPYARAECVALEAGNSQPRSLANAFLEPVTPGLYDSHLMKQSMEAIAEYICALERMYGRSDETRFVSSIHEWPRESEHSQLLASAIEGVLDSVFGESS